LVSSAASQADGSYSLVGLLPGMYKLHFTAVGFQDLWYPTAPGDATATAVQVDASTVTSAMPATVVGLPGSISGNVDTGVATPAPVTVQVTPEQGTTSATIPNVTTDATGHYTVSGLPTPGTYDLTFTAAHYQAGSDVEQLGGGEKRIANAVRLTAGGGEIDGLVTDGTNPLGGVSITANTNGQALTSATPTTGAVGHFALTGLATPATYLLTFTKTGFGTKTVSVFLAPGQINNNLTVSMVGGTGTVAGLVSGPTTPGGATVPLGGVTVTVNGGAAPVTTQSLTAAPLGTYVVSGLVTPGNYTLTFSKGGYLSQTVPVTLASSGSASGINATLSLSVGLISGQVMCDAPGTPPCPASGVLGGVSVTVSDGNPADTRTTITSDALSGSPPVSYSLSGLPAGAYSVTFSLSGFATQTLFVQLGSGQLVAPGQPVTANVTMAPSP
jgi:5-hydroxyisourate hydrolase-like protein (transthyretin family)